MWRLPSWSKKSAIQAVFTSPPDFQVRLRTVATSPPPAFVGFRAFPMVPIMLQNFPMVKSPG